MSEETVNFGLEPQPEWEVTVCGIHGIIPEDEVIEGQDHRLATANNPDGFSGRFYCARCHPPSEEVRQVDVRAESALAEAREALETFGDHTERCLRYRRVFVIRFPAVEPTCLCGYSAALARIEATPEEGTFA